MRLMTMLSVGLFMLALAGGCQKFNYSKSITIGPGEVQAIVVDAPSRDQQVKVEVKSDSSPVAVFLVLEEDAETIKKNVLHGTTPDKSKVLARTDKNQTETTLEAKVPGKKGYAVVIGDAAKDTQVSLKITGG